MEILLDTSFILTCIKESMDFLEAEAYGKLLLPKEVILELENKAKQNKKESKSARVGLEIINKNQDKFKIIKLNSSHVDNGILDYAKNNKVTVATLDKELKRKLKGKSKIITLKAKKRIELD
jgi:rRNA-processing protein FCF1